MSLRFENGDPEDNEHFDLHVSHYEYITILYLINVEHTLATS